MPAEPHLRGTPGAFPTDDGSLNEKRGLSTTPSLERPPVHREVSHQPDPAQHGGAPEPSYTPPTQEDTAPQKEAAEEKPSGKATATIPKTHTHVLSHPSGPKHKGPPGGYDPTPLPARPPGYRVRITFHRATKLPISDLNSLSSDPYLTADLTTDLPTRHKEDPVLAFRTRTLFSTKDPEWSEEWLLDNIPASGFKLKVRIFDEDRGDSDDRLGNAHIQVGRIDEKWEGIINQPYKIKKRMGSKRAYLLRAIAVCFHQAEEMSGRLYVSAEVLGRSATNEGGRAYTVGLNYWCKHYAPLLGRIVGAKNTDEDEDESGDGKDAITEEKKGDGATAEIPTHDHIPGSVMISKKKKARVNKYNFQANQMQLTGPVPPELYHRFVEFRPFIKALFTASGIRGILMQKALHHQHAQVYNFDRETKYGVFKQGPCEAMTQRFLDLCHHDEGGRMFTYVITLDALMRFTETGKEFGIDLLSKHTMHADACNYIAYSGEFFIRRRQDAHHNRNRSSNQPREAQRRDKRNVPSATTDSTTDDRPVTNGTPKPSVTQIVISEPTNPDPTPISPIATPETTTTHALPSRPIAPTRTSSAGPSPTTPSNYELIIDNDSGTYRPNAALLPLLHSFLSANLPGLKIITLDCQADAELMSRLKTEQREKKKKAAKEAGGRVVYQQVSASSSESSVSSSDRESLDRRAEESRAEESRAEENMVEDTYRRDEFAGTGQGRGDRELHHGERLRESQVGPMDRRRVSDKEGGSPVPRHRMAEAVLPFVQNQTIREQLMTKPVTDGAVDGTEQMEMEDSQANVGVREGRWTGSLAGGAGAGACGG